MGSENWPTGADRGLGSRSVPAEFGQVRRCLLVIPGKPALGIFKQLRGVFLKRRQVMERVDVVEGAGVNEAHEQIPDISPVLSPIKQTVLPVLNCPLKNLFTEVVVQWGARNV